MHFYLVGMGREGCFATNEATVAPVHLLSCFISRAHPCPRSKELESVSELCLMYKKPLKVHFERSKPTNFSDPLSSPRLSRISTPSIVPYSTNDVLPILGY